MLPSLLYLAWLLACLAGLAVSCVEGQEKLESTATAADARLRQVCRADLAQYAVRFSNQAQEKFASHEVMTWTNPVRDRQLGVVTVWVASGRPEAIGTVFTHPRSPDSVQLQHELHSLSLSRLQADLPSGERRWDTAKPGVELKPIAGAPEPAGIPAARLLQMRALARQFSAHSVDRQESRWELRLLAQPLFRYEPREPDLVDGALFAFLSTAGTDPELLLLIEARIVDGKPRWHLGAARFSDHSLYLKYRHQEVWSFVNVERRVQFAAGVTDSYRFVFDRMVNSSAEEKVGKE